jgi:SAM-dependent methyltransferase
MRPLKYRGRVIAAGAVPSPNIWNTPQVYELENRAVDPDGRIETAMRAVRDWAGGVVLDVGCGTGFHLPRFAATASTVIGVEPHDGLAKAARRRIAGLKNAQVRVGAAQSLPIPDSSIEVAHARWAYFFGPGCEPGLTDLDRVMRRGGTSFVIDNDASTSTFGRWFRRWLPGYDPAEVERFWARQGYQRTRIEMRWVFERRADLAAVLRIEFPAELAAAFLAERDGLPCGLEVDYAVNLFWRHH